MGDVFKRSLRRFFGFTSHTQPGKQKVNKMKIKRAQKHQPPQQQSLKKMAGLGLLEAMLFLFVIGTILVVGYAWLAAKSQAERAETTKAQLQYVNRYIESFAAVNYRLPCPATTIGGAEDCTSPTNVKGYLPYASIGLSASDTKAGDLQMLYMVSRSAVADLGAATNVYEPIKLKNTVAVPDTYALAQISTGDYCRKLALSGAEATGVSVFTGGTGRRVAYSVAHPGQVDADDSGSLFDGRNANLSNSAMEAPDVAQVSGSYDDRVLARSAGDLMFTNDCASHIASLNLMGLGVNVISEVQDQFAAAKEAADLEILVSIFKTLIAAYGVGMAGISLGASIVELGVMSAALAVAVGTCIVLVGCAFIPPYTAAVTAGSIAIGLNVAGVALAVAAVVINVVYIVLVAEVAALAGSAATQANPDLTTQVEDARLRWVAATAEKNNAAARLVTAQNDLAAADPARTTARNNLYSTTGSTINSANLAGVPVTTTATTTNDSFVADVVAKYTLLAQAKAAVAAANQAVATAQQSAVGYVAPPGTSVYTAAELATIAAKQTLANNAITAQGAAQTTYDTARNALIAINRRAYTVTTTVIIPGSPPTSVTTTTTGHIDNRAAITTQITTYEEKYTAFAVAENGVLLAQDSYNKAVVAETGAKDAYDQLRLTSTTVATPIGNVTGPWGGAEALLREADAKGGMR